MSGRLHRFANRHRNDPYERLLIALSPDPSRWEWRGERVKSRFYGEFDCACGHPILWLHTIYCRDTGRPLLIGVVCLRTHFKKASTAHTTQLALFIDVPWVVIPLISLPADPASSDAAPAEPQWIQMRLPFET